MTRLEQNDHVVIVGAGLAGWRLVESLRREGYEGAITLVGDEVHHPYDRPPLSKQILTGKWDVVKSSLVTDERLDEVNVTLRLGSPAVTLDVHHRVVTLEDGASLRGSHVVIATGTRARDFVVPSSVRLPTIRSRDDVVELAATLETLEPDRDVVVIGGGFVGAEVATSLKTRGLTPLVLEVAERPLINAVGDEVSQWLARLPADHGVELRTNQRVNDVRVVDDGYSVHVEGGEPIHAGAVVAAVGSVVDVGWLEGSGLDLTGGINVDDDLQAAPDIAAIGDVARFRWRNTLGEELVRIEHWQVATDHAAHLAHYWVHGERQGLMIPYFWSDQYGKKLQMLGHPHLDDDVHRVAGSPEEGKWLALYSRGGVVTGVVALSQPRGLMLSKPYLESLTKVSDALVHAPWAS